MYRLLASAPYGIAASGTFQDLQTALHALYALRRRECAIGGLLSRNPNAHLYAWTLG